MITISAFKWVPEFAQGQVRDLRARWALEEAGLPYKTRLLELGDQTLDDAYSSLPEQAGYFDLPDVRDFVCDKLLIPEAAFDEGVIGDAKYKQIIIALSLMTIKFPVVRQFVRGVTRTLRGMVPTVSPVDFRKPIADETEKWAKVVKFFGVSPD